MRVLAEMSDEIAMIKEFVEGNGDIHGLTASKVYSKIEGKEVIVNKKTNSHLRHNGKTLNFAMSYGAGAYKIGKGLNISQEEAGEIIESFYKAFPKLSDYFKSGHKFVTENGYILVDNVTKRRSYFPFFKDYLKLKDQIEDFKRKKTPITKSMWSEFFTMKGVMERASQNYRIQGLAASMTKSALVYFYKYLLENDLFDSVQMILVLHDEIVVLAKDEVADQVDKALEECMMRAGRIFCKRVPMEVSGGICEVWDH